MGMSLDRHYNSTAGLIAPWLKFLFVVKKADFSLQGLLALGQTFGTEPIDVTAGMVTLEERMHPPMHLWHMRSNHRKPSFAFGTSNIIPLVVIQGVVHILALILQPDSTGWYLSHRIVLNDFGVFNIGIIVFDV
jgi:hypothetical protein